MASPTVPRECNALRSKGLSLDHGKDQTSELLAYRLSCPGYEARLTCYMTRLAFGWRREQDEVCWETTGTARKKAKQTFAVISRRDRIASSRAKGGVQEGHFAGGSIAVDSILNDSKHFNHGRRRRRHSQALLRVLCAVQSVMQSSCRVKLPILRRSDSEKTYQCLRRGNGMHLGWAAVKTR
jgi:hypothetical protein